MSQSYRLFSFESVDSTQLELKRMLSEHRALEPFDTVSTASQTKGKGRGVSVWHDVPGNSALFSVYIPWTAGPSESFLLNQWVCHSLAAVLPKRVQFKWPNDLMVDAKKLGGMLIENHWEGKRIKSTIVGLGINVKSTTGQLERATTLEALGMDIHPDEVREEIIHSFQRSLTHIQNEALLRRRYDERLWGKDQFENYALANGTEIKGQVSQVDSLGRLQLKDEGGQTHKFNMDEIKWIQR